MNMDPTMNQASAFGALLRQNPQAARFYDSCNAQQRQAILEQLPKLTSQAQLQSFVNNLPSAAL